MTKNKNFLAAAAAFTTAVTLSAAASADVFIKDYNDAGVWNAYDADNQAYAMKFRSDQGKDGFWLVVTDGSNPKGDGTTNAILYGDLINNRITAYTYNGENNSESFESGTFLGSYEDAFSSGGTHFKYGYDMTMFSLDVSAINNAIGTNFDGVEIGENAGIWFHQSSGSDFTYGADGSIVDYTFQDQMWLDRGNDATLNKGAVDCSTSTKNLVGYLGSCASTELAGGIAAVNPGTNGGTTTTGTTNGVTGTGGGSVPAPGGLALVFAGLAGLGLMRRRKKS